MQNTARYFFHGIERDGLNRLLQGERLRLIHAQLYNQNPADFTRSFKLLIREKDQSG